MSNNNRKVQFSLVYNEGSLKKQFSISEMDLLPYLSSLKIIPIALSLSTHDVVCHAVAVMQWPGHLIMSLCSSGLTQHLFQVFWELSEC